MKDKPKLIPLSMIICDTVIEDRKTGKKTLVGLFNKINARNVPVTITSFNVYIALTEGNGIYESKLKCLKDEKHVLEIEGPVDFHSPRQIVEMNYTLRNIVFPEYGEYRIELLCNDTLVISRKFNISPITNQKKEGNDVSKNNK